MGSPGGGILGGKFNPGRSAQLQRRVDILVVDTAIHGICQGPACLGDLLLGGSALAAQVKKNVMLALLKQDVKLSR